MVSAVSVQSVCFSDHHLLTCHLGVPLTPPVVGTYSYGHCVEWTRQPSATPRYSPIETVLVQCNRRWLISRTSTPRSDECWTYTRLCLQVADAASTITVVSEHPPRQPIPQDSTVSLIPKWSRSWSGLAPKSKDLLLVRHFTPVKKIHNKSSTTSWDICKICITAP